MQEKSITRLDDLINKTLHVIAYGTSYLGKLIKVDHENGVILLQDEYDTVTIDLERIDSYSEAELEA